MQAKRNRGRDLTTPAFFAAYPRWPRHTRARHIKTDDRESAMISDLQALLRRAGSALGSVEDDDEVDEGLPRPAPPGTRGLSIFRVCHDMYQLGYRYATLIHSGRLDLNGVKYGGSLGVGPKPDNALYLSPIVRGEDGGFAPLWFRHIVRERDLVASYDVGSLGFVKVHPNADILDEGRMRPYLTPFYWHDWDEARRETEAHGFETSSSSSPWDVPTLVIWDAAALVDIVVFQHALAPFTYVPRDATPDRPAEAMTPGRCGQL